MNDEAVDDDDDDFAPSPPGTPPTVPTFLLPPERVIITQPTPETQFSPHQGTLHELTAACINIREYLPSSHVSINIRNYYRNSQTTLAKDNSFLLFMRFHDDDDDDDGSMIRIRSERDD
jgi:hypothetical protein